jgi:hypothetical protein
MIVFGRDIEHPLTVDDVECSGWPTRHVRASGVGQFCADTTFWKLLAEGPWSSGLKTALRRAPSSRHTRTREGAVGCTDTMCAVTP